MRSIMQEIPVVSYFKIKNILFYASKIGLSLGEMCRIVEVNYEDLNNDGFAGIDKIDKVYTYIADKLKNPFWTYEFIKSPLIHTGPLYTMSKNCPNLKVMMEMSMKHFAVLGNYYKMDSQREGNLLVNRMTSEFWNTNFPDTYPMDIEITIGVAANTMFNCFPDEVKFSKIHFDFEPRGAIEKYEELFRLTPGFSKQENIMAMDIKYLDYPTIESNRDIFNLLTNYLENQPKGNNTLSDKVRKIIQNQFTDHFPQIELVSREVNMSPRKLQRLLKNENTSYRKILNKVKMEMAHYHVKNGSLNINEIAVLLGYNDTSNFIRAFKIWFDQSPSHFKLQN